MLRYFFTFRTGRITRT